MIWNVQGVIVPGTQKSEAYAEAFQQTTSFQPPVSGKNRYDVTFFYRRFEPDDPAFRTEKWPGESDTESGYDEEGRVFYAGKRRRQSASAYVFNVTFPAA